MAIWDSEFCYFEQAKKEGEKEKGRERGRGRGREDREREERKKEEEGKKEGGKDSFFVFLQIEQKKQEWALSLSHAI